MRNPAQVKSVNSKSVNPNDIVGAALALAALEITQPALMEEDEEEYGNSVERILEEYCPLFRVPTELQTPAESQMAEAMHVAILAKSDEILKKMRASRDPLMRLLAGPQRTIAD
jgi:hypothetical protein